MLDFFCGLRQQVGIARTEDHACAFGTQACRDGSADAPVRSRNDRNLALQSGFHRFSIMLVSENAMEVPRVVKACLLAVLLAASLLAQQSPPAETAVTIAGKAIRIKYSAPAMRGRKIFGG